MRRTGVSRETVESSESTELLAALVLAHLAGHPHAADSLEGVLRWWIGDDGRFGAAAVERALEHLVAIGHLRREPLADGRCLYAAAKRRSDPDPLHLH